MTKYEEASEALQEAHNACFKHTERDVLGMSHGPFSGVNKALGIISQLESENKELRAERDEIANGMIGLIDAADDMLASFGDLPQVLTVREQLKKSKTGLYLNQRSKNGN